MTWIRHMVRAKVQQITAGTEPITLDEAKTALGIALDDTRHDAEVTRVLAAARGYCENVTGRTLRTDVQRNLFLDRWPNQEIRLYDPPLRSVTSITYFDTSDVSQTLPTTEYDVILSTDSQGVIVWSDTFTRPLLACRPDAIKVDYLSGYTSIQNDAPALQQAVEVMLTRLWDDQEDTKNLELYKETADLLLQGHMVSDV